jgi:hypothetical protein
LRALRPSPAVRLPRRHPALSLNARLPVGIDGNPDAAHTPRQAAEARTRAALAAKQTLPEFRQVRTSSACARARGPSVALAPGGAASAAATRQVMDHPSSATLPSSGMWATSFPQRHREHPY